MELALAVRLHGVPAPLGPVDVPEGPGGYAVQPAAEVYEPVWAVDQRSEQVGGEGVDGEGLCVAVGGGGAGRLEVDAGVVDDRVHPADVVHLSGERPGLGHAGQVADDDSRRARGEASD